MKIEVIVVINESQERGAGSGKMTLELPENIIALHFVDQIVSDFISDRLILAGYPKRQKEQ